MQLLVLLLDELGYLLLDQAQIHALDGRNTHIHEVPQHEVVQVNCAHRCQISQHSYR